MDERNENISYLKFLNDKTQSYLLQRSCDTSMHIDSEPIFAEIDGSSDWATETCPILLNGSFISEDRTLESPVALDTDRSTLPELYEEPEHMGATSFENSNECSPVYPIVNEIYGKGFVTADGLFLPNDLFTQLNEEETSTNLNDQAGILTNNNDEEEVNTSNCGPFENEIMNEVNDEIADLNEGTSELLGGESMSPAQNVIQLLNDDGTVLTFSKSILNAEQLPSVTETSTTADECYTDMFETITAYKCKLCSHVCEQQLNMMTHLKTNHIAQNKPVPVDVPKATAIEETVPPLAVRAVEMRSILNSNKHKKEVKKTVYLCSQCNMGYSNKDDLKEHMILKHNLINLSQTQPVNDTSQNTKTKESTEVVREESKQKVPNDLLTTLLIKQHKASKRVKCSFKGCELRFAFDDLRIRHEECHDEGLKKQFKCPECLEKFSAWRICSSHLWKCHNIDMGLLACPMCNKFKSVSFGRMKAHMAVHNEEFPFMCHYCGKGFKQLSQLKNHQVIHKNPEIDTLPEWASQKQCDVCKKYFANSKNLKKHIQIVHNKFKPFICNICGHKAGRKAMMDLHLRQHTGEKPHKCPLCVYKTGDPNCLRRHIMRHEGVTKYSCPHCDYQSIQSTSYKNHIATKHPGLGGSFYCSVCSYHTVSETAYYIHKLEHEGNPLKSARTENNAICSVSCLTINEKEPKNCEIPVQLPNSRIELEDDETQNCFLNTDFIDDTIDTGGITIPAGLELQVSM